MGRGLAGLPLQPLAAGSASCVLLFAGTGPAALGAAADVRQGVGFKDLTGFIQLPVRGAGVVDSERANARGYFYDDIVDGTDVHGYVPPVVPLLAHGFPKADGSAGSRVLIMNSTLQGISAIDDVALKLKILLMLASALHAVPAAGRPRTLLGGIWGNSTSDSWHDYVGSVPPLQHADEVKCAAGKQVTVLWNKHWLSLIPPETRAELFDRSRPLCLLIHFLIFSMRPDWHMQGLTAEWALVLSGHQGAQLWKSQRIMELAEQARSQVQLLQGEYNVAHVRRGDFRHNCTAAERVASRMRAVDSSRPWLVMTNAEREWRDEFAAVASDLHFVLEGELQDLAGLEDNFMRYQVLQCLYGYAVNRVYSLKSLQGFCRVPGQRVEVTSGLLCRGNGDSTHFVITGSQS